MGPHSLSSIVIMLNVILETSLPCSVPSSYAILKVLHSTPQGSLHESCLCWRDRRLDGNHALLPNEGAHWTDRRTHNIEKH